MSMYAVDVLCVCVVSDMRVYAVDGMRIYGLADIWFQLSAHVFGGGYVGWMICGLAHVLGGGYVEVGEAAINWTCAALTVVFNSCTITAIIEPLLILSHSAHPGAML